MDYAQLDYSPSPSPPLDNQIEAISPERAESVSPAQELRETRSRRPTIDDDDRDFRRKRRQSDESDSDHETKGKGEPHRDSEKKRRASSPPVPSIYASTKLKPAYPDSYSAGRSAHDDGDSRRAHPSVASRYGSRDQDHRVERQTINKDRHYDRPNVPGHAGGNDFYRRDTGPDMHDGVGGGFFPPPPGVHRGGTMDSYSGLDFPARSNGPLGYYPLQGSSFGMGNMSRDMGNMGPRFRVPNLLADQMGNSLMPPIPMPLSSMSASNMSRGGSNFNGGLHNGVTMPPHHLNLPPASYPRPDLHDRSHPGISHLSNGPTATPRPLPTNVDIGEPGGYNPEQPGFDAGLGSGSLSGVPRFNSGKKFDGPMRGPIKTRRIGQCWAMEDTGVCPNRDTCTFNHPDSTKPDPFSESSKLEVPPPKIVCPFFKANGFCGKREDCQFSHDCVPESITVCKFFKAKGACASGDKCLYSHDCVPDSVPAAKQQCMYLKSKGWCIKGSACTFSHDISMDPGTAKGTEHPPAFKPTSHTAKLALAKVPLESNNITALNQYFSQFGKVITITAETTITGEHNVSAAVVEFSTPAEATKAYECKAAPLGDRHVKLMYASDSARPVTSVTPAVTSVTPAVTNGVPAVVDGTSEVSSPGTTAPAKSPLATKVVLMAKPAGVSQKEAQTETTKLYQQYLLTYTTLKENQAGLIQSLQDGKHSAAKQIELKEAVKKCNTKIEVMTADLVRIKALLAQQVQPRKPGYTKA